LAALIGEVVANPAAEVIASRGQKKLRDPPLAGLPINLQGTSEPPADTAEMGMCALNLYWYFNIPLPFS
jgi:hypothetical protein